MKVQQKANELHEALKHELDSVIAEVLEAKRTWELARSCFVTPDYPEVPDARIEVKKKRELPESPGVYFVWDVNGHVVYVGQAVNLNRRVSLSHENIVEGDAVSWLEFDEGSLNFAESYYIGVCRPVRNFGGTRKIMEAGETQKKLERKVTWGVGLAGY